MLAYLSGLTKTRHCKLLNLIRNQLVVGSNPIIGLGFYPPKVDSEIQKSGSINPKTLLDKTFRLFGNQKVPDPGVIGWKIPGLFP